MVPRQSIRGWSLLERKWRYASGKGVAVKGQSHLSSLPGGRNYFQGRTILDRLHGISFLVSVIYLNGSACVVRKF
jgi:hypothetical protein